LHVEFFFFQAEDGIRDRNVTGVQTCALPIFSGLVPGAKGNPVAAPSSRRNQARESSAPGVAEMRVLGVRVRPSPSPSVSSCGREIGRASCRERVWGWGGGVGGAGQGRGESER